ncbi:MAG: glycosyltransferase [Desulfatiglandaceae bacterium]|jgi:glycosyltransferase involved in cell wall biosynthesis
MALVSVIIPTFNRANRVKRAVSSVLFQTYEDYELIVVDDGSTDGTLDGLEVFSGRIRYLTHGSNQGVSAARNTGIRASTGPYLAFLDSDDYWLPEKLALQMDFFRKSPEIHACQTEEIWIRHGRRVNPRKKHLKPSGEIFELSLRRCLVSPSAVILERSLLEDIGLFDESLPACEDYDLWLRIASRFPIHLLRQPLVVKTGGHPDQLSARYHGMDRFRIRSMANLLGRNVLHPAQRQALMDELRRKCRIYATGCVKRGKQEEGKKYLALPDTLA